jgi:type III secretion protein T
VLAGADAILEFVFPLLKALALATARSLGLVIVVPIFTRLGLTGVIRSAVAVAIALPMLRPAYDVVVSAGGPTTFGFAAIVAKELATGLVIGVLLGVPFWAADVAGEIVDLQRGSTMAQLVDPLSIGESSLNSTLFSLAIITIFFTTGGFIVFLDVFYRSYALIPLGAVAPVLGTGAGLFFLQLLDGILRTGLMMIAPVVLALLIADIMLAYLSRMSPQMHVFDLSMAIKNLLFSFLIVLYVTFLTPFMLEQIDAMRGATDLLRTVVTGAPAPRD